jgi:BirA family biotin operon repressor/biotin-[acetyl-CoA-carboxylase] ligase
MTPAELLDALATPQGVSGSELARRAGVTRAAVWKRIAQLRDWGVEIEARAGLGYRLRHALELIDAQRIRGALSPRAANALGALDVVLDVDSTSSALLRVAREAQSGTVLFAEHQSGGRGRRGRHWQSPFAANLYFSVLWRFERGLATLGGLSLAVGVALAQSLHALGARGVGLKWPNDLVVGEAKLGGILVDAGGEWSGAGHAVIGVGLNLRMPRGAGDNIDQPWTDLAALLDPLPSRNAVAASALSHLLPALQRFAAEGLAPFLDAWHALDALPGAAIDARIGERTLHGIAAGIDDDGRLRVRDAQGAIHALSAAEVSVRRGEPA